MTEGIRKRFRETVRTMFWRKAVMPCYYTCPHEYVVRRRSLFRTVAPWGCSERDFQFLTKTIKAHSERMTWRHRSDVDFFDGRLVYFICRHIINLTDKRSMLNKRHSNTYVIAQMLQHFTQTK